MRCHCPHVVMDVAVQFSSPFVCAAVSFLHSIGLAHGDIGIESVQLFGDAVKLELTRALKPLNGYVHDEFVLDARQRTAKLYTMAPEVRQLCHVCRM